ncbi:MAG: hypothetical protein WBW70_19030, partial [Candidatus Sulfotelmatobacter sp.]
HQIWERPEEPSLKRGHDELEKAQKIGAKTERERGYISALEVFYSDTDPKNYLKRAAAYSDAMAKLYQQYPKDLEAGAFYALSLLASEPPGDKSHAARKKAVEVLNPLFQQQPDHPGLAHYIIHSCDSPDMAPMALDAARRYAEIAPSSAHAVHMPSHIFARVGLWQDDINSNLASIAATRKTAAMHMGGEGHQFHAMDFLVYAYLQSGREADAQKVIDEVKAMPKMKSMYGDDFDPQTNALTKFPAIYDLELRHWSDAAVLQVVPGSLRGDQSITYWARAIGAARSGNLAQAHKDLEQIEAIRKEFVAEKKTEYAEAVGEDYQEAAAWVAHAEGKDEEAITGLRVLADKTDKLGDEPEGIPAREQLADMLLEAKRPQQALAEYQTDLRLNPNRFNGLYGAARAAEAAGKQADATEYYALLLKICDGSNSTRPELSRARELVAQK